MARRHRAPGRLDAAGASAYRALSMETKREYSRLLGVATPATRRCKVCGIACVVTELEAHRARCPGERVVEVEQSRIPRHWTFGRGTTRRRNVMGRKEIP